MKPILLICGCRQYDAHLRAAIERFTHPDWMVVGVMGSTAEAAAYDPEMRILTLPVPDTYEALPQKVHASLAWILATWPDTPGVFKTDDDILMQDLSALSTAIRDHLVVPYWGLITHRCNAAYVPLTRIKGRFTDKSFRPKHQRAHYCFGHGYWLSQSALAIAVAAETDYATSYLEDVCTGFVMNRAGIEPVHVPVPYKEMPRCQELLHYSRTRIC